MQAARYDWTVREARALHDSPLPELLFQAQEIHRRHHQPGAVQLCTLLSVKTGGCPEDCAYCPQSAHHDTGLPAERLMSVESVLEKARLAKESGATRFCMGAAWRNPRGKDFEQVLAMVSGVRTLGLEACATLGMLSAEQAERLAAAGLTAYNHNLDTSRDYYRKIISTRSYDERLETLDRVAQAGISVCCGGIIGMGESVEDRCALLCELARMRPHPGSVPINALAAVEGTPLAERPTVDPLELVRMIACARIMMPTAMVRLSAGREGLSREAQLLCFLAGANSIFYGDKLLTTGNPDIEADRALFRDAGLTALEIHEGGCSSSCSASEGPQRSADALRAGAAE